MKDSPSRFKIQEDEPFHDLLYSSNRVLGAQTYFYSLFSIVFLGEDFYDFQTYEINFTSTRAMF